jgi:hypothetical protein
VCGMCVVCVWCVCVCVCGVCVCGVCVCGAVCVVCAVWCVCVCVFVCVSYGEGVDRVLVAHLRDHWQCAATTLVRVWAGFLWLT